MPDDPVYVLIQSPLVGPVTWQPVASEMRRGGQKVLVPALEDSPASRDPFWKQNAESVSRSLAGLSKDVPVTLVAHSGAGPLLPAIRQLLPNPIQAYIFVDAGIPQDGASRLELMKSEDPAWAAQFEADLQRGKRFPTWSDEDLQEINPDDTLRRQMVAELRPRGVSFFSEPIPVFEGWPDAPCAYILLSAPYQKAFDQAQQAGWLTARLDAGHFHMLVDAKSITDLILDLGYKASSSL
jgi:hypothetical protein